MLGESGRPNRLYTHLCFAKNDSRQFCRPHSSITKLMTRQYQILLITQYLRSKHQGAKSSLLGSKAKPFRGVTEFKG
eukprot:6204553-Pleurochrysis_carterae.AAC.2